MSRYSRTVIKKPHINENKWLNRSAELTRKFYLIDTMTNQMAEWLTFEEVDKIVSLMEIRSQSKLEGNWTVTDCIDFFKETLGVDRYDTIRNLWTLDNQRMIEQYNQEENLKEIWIHKISQREVDPQIAKLDLSNHMPVKVPK